MALVLVVDNDADTCDTLVELARSEFPEIEMVTATSGQEALERLGGRTPQLILADYKMPDLNGIEFLRRAREQNEARRVLWTVHDTDDEVRAAERDGTADAVCSKFDITRVRNILGTA